MTHIHREHFRNAAEIYECIHDGADNAIHVYINQYQEVKFFPSIDDFAKHLYLGDYEVEMIRADEAAYNVIVDLGITDYEKVKKIVKELDKTDYLETYFVIVEYMAENGITDQIREHEGMGVAWEYAKKLADEFNHTHKDTQWGKDLDFHDTLDTFLNHSITHPKNKNMAHKNSTCKHCGSANTQKATYYLFGEQAVQIYEEEGIEAVIKSEYGYFRFQHGITHPSELLAAADGWYSYTEISNEEYNILTTIKHETNEKY